MRQLTRIKSSVGAKPGDHEVMVIRVVRRAPVTGDVCSKGFTVDPHKSFTSDPVGLQLEMIRELKRVCSKWGVVL